jgi:hypothetical protein
MNAPLPRLLRLRAALAEALPHDDVKDTDAEGLAATYQRLRSVARSLAGDLGVSEEEFDAQFPEMAGRPMPGGGSAYEWAQRGKHNESVARSAATSLRQLAGFLGRLIEAVALDEKITVEQIAAAREAARPSFGFR